MARRRRRRLPAISPTGFIIIGIAVAAVVLLLFTQLVGCGPSHGSATGVVKSLIEGYAKGRQNAVLDCYGQKKDTEETLIAEVSATQNYLDAHNYTKIEVGQVDTLGESEDVVFVYALYRLVLDDGQKYPCLSTYAVQEQDGKSYVLAPSQISEELSDAAAEAYTKFMTTDTYKDYLKDYNTFVKKNPGYEDKVAGRLGL